MDYAKLLEDSYRMESVHCEGTLTRLCYLSDSIFNFTTYDPEMSELLARKALDVCSAISEGSTFEYIGDPDRYRWYVLLINMPFFAERLDWGSSIRGAWWGSVQPPVSTCGLWDGNVQLESITFPQQDSGAAEWREFISAALAFAAEPAPS